MFIIQASLYSKRKCPTMELCHIAGKSFYIPGKVNLGLYVSNSESVLIDSGGDETAGRHLFRLFEKEGLELSAIINTHSNADHVGGNAYLQKKTQCQVLGTRIEGFITENPFMEPLILWSAFPFSTLKNKFLQAMPSRITQIIDNSGAIPGTELEAVPLPGHFLDMIGIRTPDGVFYIADSLFSEEVIDKYHLIVTLDVRSALKTIAFLETAEASIYVPCHAGVTDNILPLVKKNRANIISISTEIEDKCKTPSSREDILALLMNRYRLQLNPTQYVLNLATISAHLAYLYDEGCLEYIFEKGRMLWKKK